MKQNNSKKRAFTIVELVIVIAVIAILAAVLIPTFSGVIKRANESADIQACRQMNTYLALLDASEDTPAYVSDVIRELNNENLDLEDYKPLASGMQFYWVKSQNRIVYADSSTYKVSFPDDLQELTKTMGDWYSLNCDIDFDDSWTVADDKTVSISSGAQFASLVNAINNGATKASGVTKITLTQDIDLAGAQTKFVDNKFSDTLEIDGNNHTMYGFRDDKQTFFGSGEFTNKGYAFGLFADIGAGKNVTIKNITFDGWVVDDTLVDSGIKGLIAAYVSGTLTLDNVTIQNSYIRGVQKIGGIVGYMPNATGTVTLKDVAMKNVEIVGWCEVAKIVGYVGQGNTLKFANTDKAKTGLSEDSITVVDLNLTDPAGGLYTAFKDNTKTSDLTSTNTNWSVTQGNDKTVNQGTYLTAFAGGNPRILCGVTEHYCWSYNDRVDFTIKEGATEYTAARDNNGGIGNAMDSSAPTSSENS